MDKEWFISYMNNQFYKNVAQVNDSVELIRSYCLEMGKREEDIDKFLAILPCSNVSLMTCLSYAISYYKRKYELIEIRIYSPNTIQGYTPIAIF